MYSHMGVGIDSIPGNLRAEQMQLRIKEAPKSDENSLHCSFKITWEVCLQATHGP